MTFQGSRAFNEAEKQGIAIVMPDTSPRGDGVADVDSYDMGIGAGVFPSACGVVGVY
jgi:S-formylglutathione hydrolase